MRGMEVSIGLLCLRSEEPMIFVEVVIGVRDDIFGELTATLVQTFHRGVLMLLLFLDVPQSPLHALFVFLLEGDDVGEGRGRLGTGICLAGGVRDRLIDLLLLLGGHLLSFQ